MAASTATWHLQIASGLQLQCSLNEKPLFVGNPRSIRTNFILPRHPFSPSSILTFARRRGHQASNSPVKSKNQKKKEQISPSKGAQEDEDALEALFRLLEEDLKSDDLSLEDDDDDDDISEEELAKLERELEEALKDDELLGALDLVGDGKKEDESEEEEEEEDNGDDYTANHQVQDLEDDADEEEEEEEDNGDDYTAKHQVHDLEDDDNDDKEMPVKLKNWQLKRLAYALKKGRRKTNIKNLTAELCLDRAVVLGLLRDPPPDLLMMSAALPDKPVSTVVEPVNKLTETVDLEMTSVTAKPDAEAKVPVHVRQSNWFAKKRIKKAQLDTLERVYNRTKRPTNAMISNIVHLTNLPRRRVVEWFEDKRAAAGVPKHRLPYGRSAPTFT